MKSMRDAIKDAGIKPEDIDYVNVHGTSTPAGDIPELKAVAGVLGDHVYNVNISSTKSMTGHLLGAAGAAEALACIFAITHGVIPPTINCDNLDPESVPAGQRTSTLHLYGEIRSKLPLSLTLEPVFSSTRLDFTVAVDAKKVVNPIAESDGTQLFRKDLEQIISGVEVRIPITLERYYPALGFRPEEQEQIAIDLRLVKRGGLKLDIQ